MQSGIILSMVSARGGRAIRQLGIVIVFSALICGYAFAAEPAQSPEIVLKRYLIAHYARDSDAAYALLAKQDRATKSLHDYQAENGNYRGAALELSNELAQAIRFHGMSSQIDNRIATIRFDASLPDANDAALSTIVQGFNQEALSQLDSDEVLTRRLRIKQLIGNGQLPFLNSKDEQWELIKENGQWRVLLNWADGIKVHFDAVVVGDLGWVFTPKKDLLFVQPGQTVQMAYIAKNIGPTETTGKARHIIGPANDKDLLEIIACFCFLDQTLAPGEQVEMPLAFRVNFDVPEEKNRFTVKYEFFRSVDFPKAALQ